MSFAQVLRLGVLGGIILFAIVTLVGCSKENNAPAAFVEAIPANRSTIQPYTPITVKFDSPPLGLSCYTCVIEDGTVSETVDISHTGKLSQSGEIITITGPFKSDRLLTIRLEWGLGDSETPSSPLSKSEVTLEYTVVPEWTDGVITITAGRFKDRSKLQALFRNEGWKSSNPHFGGFADKEFTLPVFPMAQQTYTVDIAIVPMSEVGIDKPATIETIRERYLEQGYRPLTLEEMYELRLQFADQSKGSCVEESTNAFHVLLSRDDIYSYSRDDDTIHDIDRVYSIPILVGPRRGLWGSNTSASITGAPCRLSAQLRFPAPPEPLTGHVSAVNSVSFSPNGRMLASGGYDHRIRLWDVDTGSLIRTFRVVFHTFSVSFSPNGRMLASGSAREIRLWDVDTGSLIRTFKGHTQVVNSVSFSPDGQMLASGSDDHTIRLWEVDTGSLIAWYPTMQTDINSVSFSPNGRMLASGSKNGSIHLGEVNKVLSSWVGHTHAVNSVSFSPNGRMLASGSDDHTIRLWDVDTGSLIGIRTFEGHTAGVNSVSFSPNSRTLASGSDDHTIRLWDVDTGSLIRTFKWHTASVNSVSFSPDGQKYASGSNDHTIRLWDPKINYYSGSSEVGLFGKIYVDRMKSLTKADDDGWVLISPYSDKYLEYISGYRSCATRFACVLMEERN